MLAGAVLPRLRPLVTMSRKGGLLHHFLRSQSRFSYGRVNHTNSDPRAFPSPFRSCAIALISLG